MINILLSQTKKKITGNNIYITINKNKVQTISFLMLFL